MSNDIDRIEVMDAQMHQPQVRPKVNSANFVDINAIVAKAVMAEREACAKLAETLPFRDSQMNDARSDDIAAAIRARK